MQKLSTWLPLALAVAAGYMLTRPSAVSRHISWQEFRINHLEKGDVERLEVVNRGIVRVYLRRDYGTSSPGVRLLVVMLWIADAVTCMQYFVRIC